MSFLRDNNDEIKEEYKGLATKQDQAFYTIIRDINKLKANKNEAGEKVSQQILVSLYSFLDKDDSFVNGVREWNKRVSNVREFGFVIDQDTIAALETGDEEKILYPIVESLYIKQLTEG